MTTGDVIIRVKGIQAMGEEDTPEPVEVVTVGKHYFRNGSHYLRYDELMEGFQEPSVNYIKLSPDSVEVRKKGLTNVHMVFEHKKKNITFYTTPFGQLELGISTTDIQMQEEEDRIHADVEYALEINNEHAADCWISIEVEDKKPDVFHQLVAVDLGEHDVQQNQIIGIFLQQVGSLHPIVRAGTLVSPGA